MLLPATRVLIDRDLMALLLGAVAAVATTAGSAWSVARLLHRTPDELPGWGNVLCLLVGLGMGLAVWWATSR